MCETIAATQDGGGGDVPGMDDVSHADMLKAWVSGWTKSRRVARPVACAGGLRVDTGSARERVRYVFFGLDEAAIRQVAAAETAPGVAIKACVTVDELASVLTGRWQLHEQRALMSTALARAGQAKAVALPEGYALTREVRAKRCP